MLPKIKKGYGAVQEEEVRREKAKEAKKGKLWRFIMKEDEQDVPIRFLTEEPICYHEHTLKQGTSYVNVPCTGNGCENCADGARPQFVGAWLVVDGRSFDAKERDANGKETGKTKVMTDRVKLLVRGMRDAAQLERLSEKFGLTNRPYTVTRTGSGTASTWRFEREDSIEGKEGALWEVGKLTPQELKIILAQLPEKLRDLDLDSIVEAQIVGLDDEEEEASEETKKEAKGKVDKGVVSSDEDEPAPKKATRVGGRANPAKKVK